MAKASSTIQIPPLNLQTVHVPIVGDSPLICHAWSKKTRAMMLAKYQKKASAGREAKDPWMDFCESLYWLDGMPDRPTEADVERGRFGFPAVGFKSSMVSACTSIGGVTKIAARQCFHIDCEFIEIKGPPPSMREDIARVGMGAADIRFRGEFDPWKAILPLRYNANLLSAEQLVNLVQAAGFAVGIGDWRPERDGPYGRFRVDTGDAA